MQRFRIGIALNPHMNLGENFAIRHLIPYHKQHSKIALQSKWIICVQQEKEQKENLLLNSSLPSVMKVYISLLFPLHFACQLPHTQPNHPSSVLLTKPLRVTSLS